MEYLENASILALRIELKHARDQHPLLVRLQKFPQSLGGTTYREVEENAKMIVYLFNLLEIREAQKYGE